MIRNNPIPLGLLEATRLTRVGRLLEATALIQRTLRDRSPAAEDVVGRTPGHDADDAIEGEYSRVADAASPAVAPPPHLATHDTCQGVAQNDPCGLRTRGSTAHRTRSIDGRPGEFLSGSYAAQSGARPYKLYIPTAYTGQALPLVVMLHGCTQSADDFASGTRMNVLAEEWKCLVLYPEQTPDANHSRCWNWFKRSHQRRERGEPAILAGMTGEIIDRYGIERGNVYIAGLSAGGAMAAVMGTAYPDLYAAVGVHSGLACGSAHDLKSALAAMGGKAGSTQASTDAAFAAPAPPTIAFHADRDGTVHPRNSEQVVAQAVAQQSMTSTDASIERGQVPGGHAYTRTVYRDAVGRAFLEHWLVHAGGHAWFGGSPRGSYVDPKGPDASREMIRFFYQSKSRQRS